MKENRKKCTCCRCGEKGEWKLDTSIQKMRMCDECLKTEDEFWEDFCVWRLTRRRYDEKEMD